MPGPYMLIVDDNAVDAAAMSAVISALPEGAVALVPVELARPLDPADVERAAGVLLGQLGIPARVDPLGYANVQALVDIFGEAERGNIEFVSRQLDDHDAAWGHKRPMDRVRYYRELLEVRRRLCAEGGRLGPGDPVAD